MEKVKKYLRYYDAHFAMNHINMHQINNSVISLGWIVSFNININLKSATNFWYANSHHPGQQKGYQYGPVPQAVEEGTVREVMHIF